MPRDRSAGLIVIGNEILSGKVADTNSTFLARGLRELGVTLRRILVVPDELDEITAAVREFKDRYDVVFTSGGVGPTHDDVTIEGVARGLDRAVIRHPHLESLLRGFFGDKINEPRLKMADVVEGTELILEGSVNFPTVVVENIFILPGIPELFEEKFNSIRQRLGADPFHLRVIYTNRFETTIAQFLNQTMAEFPELMLGSYPKLNDPEYRVKVTLESKDRDYLQRAFARLLALLPPDAVVRTE